MTQNLKLTIELAPASSWNQNLRSLLKPQMWDEIRKNVYKKYKFKCSICGAGCRRPGGPLARREKLHAHEVWKYDDKNHIQKLVDIIAICAKCHAVKHIGLAGIQASEGKLNFESLIKHFIKVNNCSREVFEKHRDEAFKKFEERSHFQWSLDFFEYQNKKIK